MGRRTLLLIASILVAALGTALIWLYVQGADTRAEASTTSVQIPVPVQDYQPGTLSKNIATVPRAFPQSLVDSFGTALIRDPQAYDGYSQGVIAKGLPLLTTQFGKQSAAPAPAVQLSPDKLALQVTLPDPQRLAGLLQSGSLIRIYATAEQGKKKQDCTHVLLDKVKVLASGAVSEPAATTGAKTEVPQAIVTLELNNSQALLIVNSQTQKGGGGGSGGGGNLWFGLLGAKTPAASFDDPPFCTRTDA